MSLTRRDLEKRLEAREQRMEEIQEEFQNMQEQLQELQVEFQSEKSRAEELREILGDIDEAQKGQPVIMEAATD